MPQVRLNEAGDLIMADQNRDVLVRAARAFPWTSPTRFVILRDTDGDERAAIDDLDDLDAPSRSAIEVWLERHTFVPRVTRVNEARPVNAAWRFEFATDRGDATVILKEREDLRSLPDGRTLLRDGDGRTFEIPPPESLDRHSQNELAKLV
jgi:hypothetical protein